MSRQYQAGPILVNEQGTRQYQAGGILVDEQQGGSPALTPLLLDVDQRPLRMRRLPQPVFTDWTFLPPAIPFDPATLFTDMLHTPRRVRSLATPSQTDWVHQDNTAPAVIPHFDDDTDGRTRPQTRKRTTSPAVYVAAPGSLDTPRRSRSGIAIAVAMLLLRSGD